MIRDGEAPTGLPRYPSIYVARVTIQFETPFAVRRGAGDLLTDSAFVADAAGLPALPGSSIAGVLRHGLEEYAARSGPMFTADHIRDLFGFSGLADDKDGGRGSRLSVSWGCIHDAADRPVEGLSAASADPVLLAARRGVLRDHVRIDHRGTADDTGKFDERLVGAGHRFTFELAMPGREDNDEGSWNLLLGVLLWPGLRLGGCTRRGFGRFSVERIRARRFDLQAKPGEPVSADVMAFRALPVPLSSEVPDDLLPDITKTLEPTPVRPLGSVTLRGLEATGAWLFGGGSPVGLEDIAPVSEPRVVWTTRNGRDHGDVSAVPSYFLPTSAIKGVLAHRVGWHFNRLAGRFADDQPDSRYVAALTGSANAAVRTLFGTVPKRDEGEARAGALLMDDIHLDGETGSQTDFHVAIDRFTGGVRAAALFQERVLHPRVLGDYRILFVDPDAALKHAGTDRDMVREALRAALEDVRRGRLAFGAGAARGNGGFRCRDVDWNPEEVLA
jgi:CRISPR/Cas system CSM-associated protein Csm3 (group 7 of RAMP superfamily)